MRTKINESRKKKNLNKIIVCSFKYINNKIKIENKIITISIGVKYKYWDSTFYCMTIDSLTLMKCIHFLSHMSK